MKNLTAKEILSAKTVGEIFTNNASAIKSEYVFLSKKWHPDYNGNSDESNQVMIKINILYKKALDMIKNNLWESDRFIRLRLKHANELDIKYIKTYTFELGEIFICKDKVIYLLDNKYKMFYNNYIEITSSLRYGNDDMKKEFSKYVPINEENMITDDNRFVISVNKPSDLILLKDVLDYYHGVIPDRHVAWILSTLYNLACFIDYNKLSHNGITINNYFISPKFHSGTLLGGWWYSTKSHNRMLGISKDLYNIIPPKVKENKLGSIITDLESIRLIGKQLLGEKNGCMIKYNKSLPKPFVEWLLMGSSDSAFDEYKKWNIVLTNAYGKRRFVEMNLSADTLYK